MIKTPERLRVPLSQIDTNDTTFKFRLDMPEDEIKPLSSSMQQSGLLNPIKLRKKGDKYQMIAGWERLQSAENLGWKDIPAEVYPEISYMEAYDINIADNQLRTPLSPLETSNLIANMKNNLKLSVIEISERLGYGTPLVYDYLKLVEVKPEIKQAVHLEKINLQDAIRLQRIPDTQQLKTLEKSISEEWTHQRFRRARIRFTFPEQLRFDPDKRKKMAWLLNFTVNERIINLFFLNLLGNMQ
jgi:ParB family chromosome partitioning protein